MRRKIALSICILFGCLYMTYGQLMNNQSFNETFRYRVKQMDEFMKRFNGMESIPLALEDSLIRRTNMLYLFDSELFLNTPDSMKNAAFKNRIRSRISLETIMTTLFLKTANSWRI